MNIEDKKDQVSSQIEPSDKVKNLLSSWDIKSLATVDGLVLLRAKLISIIESKPYNLSTRDLEKQIRWKRTGSQVIEDGYVYEGKGCTDRVLAFLTLVKASGVSETNFVKLRTFDGKIIHSICEVKLPDGWYIFEIANNKSTPVKGQIQEGLPWNFPGVAPMFLWKKGRDSWDIGLTSYVSKHMMEV